MLLSQDHINRLIEPDARSGAAPVLLPLHDEEFLTNYVALLKAISVRLSPDTVRPCEVLLCRCHGLAAFLVYKHSPTCAVSARVVILLKRLKVCI